MNRQRGTSPIEALLAATVGLLMLTALTGALAGGARVLVRGGARAEATDTSGLAGEAFLFDVRRAGYDGAAIGVAPVALARTDRVTLEADLDGDGAVDAGSAEHVSWVCSTSTRRLSRILGAQSMPVAGGVLACGFSYLDGGGAALVPPAGGLDAAGRAQIAAIILDFRLAPRGGGPPIETSLGVALRSR